MLPSWFTQNAFVRSILPSLLLAASGAQAGVVINEIMYRPGTTYPENTGLEFLELHNTDAAAVDISGWALTSGTAFTFPAATSIPAGGFLVVAANPTLVQNAYGISGVFGPWAAGSSLSNSGEKITLSKPGTVAGTFTSVDSVTYANEGDWATRVREATFGGWDWSTGANGANKSMELRNPAISNDNGQNWAVSASSAGATPGAQNSVVTGNVAPIIHGVKHSPAVPQPTDTVTISCNVTDESASAFLEATLFWRDSTGTSPGAFTSQAMTGDGAGGFSTSLGPKANLTIVEFYVSVTDGVNTRTWPAPTSEGQNANCQYQVNSEALNPTAAYYFMVLTGAENGAYNNLAASNPNSDRQFNQTLIVSNGTDTSVRYRAAMRIRGNSSRTYQFKPLRISVPGDDKLDGGTVFNLNPKASFLQFTGMRMFQLAGVRAPDSVPVKPRRNGVESTTSGGSTPDYGWWAREEDLSGDMVNNHWGDLTGGSLYKKIDNGGSLNYYWRSGQAAPSNPDTLLDGWGKQNNSGANDWTDLTSFFQVWQAAAAPHFPGSSPTDVSGSNATRISGNGNWNSTAFTNAEMTSIETVADLDQWARWFAVMTIIQDLETKISNGVDDDYAVYFVPAAGGQRKLQMVAHDCDTILSLGDNPQPFNYTGLYDMTEGGQSNYTFRSLLPLFGTTSVAGNAAFRAKYFAAIRELYGTVFNSDTTSNPNPAFYQFLDSHLTGWAPAGTISSIKTWMTQRQSYLLGLVGAAATTPPPATSNATVVSTPGTLMIHEVLANNVAAHLNGATYPDVIELYNSGATAISLVGMSITDDPLLKAKYVFPAGTTIGAGGYLIVYADADTAAPGLHAGFGLDGDGDGVYLFDTVANSQTALDGITFGLQPADFSIGRTGAARDTWAICTPSVGGANTAVAALAAPAGLKINEWAGNRDYLLVDDFLELYNSAAQPIAIGGMGLTDDFINYPFKHTLPQLSFIAPGAFQKFVAKGGSASAGNASELPFSIDASAGWLALTGVNGTIADSVDVVAQAHDTSRGRSPNGGGAIATFGLPTNIPTPGSSNVAPPASVLALLNGLRISELLYTPGNLEYIELHNIGATTLDLTAVRFTKGVTYTFGAATLAPGAYLNVCRDRTAFLAQFPAAPLADGIFAGTLDNAGETIVLQPPAPWDVSILNFAYKSTWFPETDTGYSLTVINDVATLARDWGDKSTWSASPALYGTPGTDSPPSVTSPTTASGLVSQAFSYQIVATKNPTSYNATPLPAGLSVNTSTGLISGTPTTTGTTNVTISATNGGGTGTRTLALSITTPPPPTITSAGTATATTGVPFTYQIVANSNPSAYDATPLPAGLSVNTSSGLISGTPTGVGGTNVTLSATNSFGTGTKQLTITVSLPPAPGITSAGTASGVLSDAFSYQIIATNTPTSYDATGLPGGLSVNTASGLISGAPTAVGTFNATVSATNAGGTGSKAVVITIASSGPLASFTWSAIPSPQTVGTPFAASLSAKDAQGRTVTTFTGTANLSAQGPGITAAILVITEIGTQQVDYFEIQNVGNVTANTAGWFVIPNDATGNGTGGLNSAHAAWQLPATIAPGQVIAVSEQTAGIYPGTINWSGFTFGGGNRNGWCMLCDNAGAVRDFVGWGYSAAQIPTINVASVTVGANTYTNITVPAAQWTGNAVTAINGQGYKIRVGTSDNNTTADWIEQAAENSKGTQNTNLTVPFVPPPATYPVVPAQVTFTNGAWSGNLTLNNVVAGVKLIANDGSGHTGQTNTFNVSALPPPIIASPNNAIAAFGSPFSYQIVASNSPASYNATALPAGLTINTTTGLITGPPSAVGTVNVTLSATNSSGTGNLVLSLNVQSESDFDGMGDDWEALYGLNIDINDANLDLDGDGQSNYAEWLAGTIPNDPSSKFRISSATVAGSNVTLTWVAVPGRRYRVTSATTLGAAWTNLTPTALVPTTTNGTWTHTGGFSGTARHYRIEIVP